MQPLPALEEVIHRCNPHSFLPYAINPFHISISPLLWFPGVKVADAAAEAARYLFYESSPYGPPNTTLSYDFSDQVALPVRLSICCEPQGVPGEKKDPSADHPSVARLDGPVWIMVRSRG